MQCLGRLMVEKRMPKNTIFDLDSLEAIVQLVAEEVGVSIVPLWAGLEQFDKNIIKIIIPDKKYYRKMVLMSDYHPGQPKLQALFMQHLNKLNAY